MKTLLLLGAALVAWTVPLAAGAAEAVVAKLAAPLPAALKPVAGGAVFECLGDVCAARSPGSDTAGVRGCRDLVRVVGSVTSFGSTSRSLSPQELANCNQSAHK